MGETVTVACKLPNGLILRVFDMVEHDEPVMGGGFRSVSRAHQTGTDVVIKGAAAPFGMEKPLVGGYALTSNVDADFFTRWLEQNAESDMVRNRMVFAHGRADHVRGQAREQDEITSGLEPLKQKGDRRSPKARNVSDVEQATA
ncbi:MAG: hypothetical protein JWQ97_3733 [Phenylobacterium sp.]|nr:hypothetical protein [Phenylobacterium sp.]